MGGKNESPVVKTRFFMYGSYRFYIDKWPNEINANFVLNIIDMLSAELNAPFDQLVHTLYSNDQDKPIVYNEYTNDTKGRLAFSNFEFVALFTGKDGKVTAPSIEATCNDNKDSIYSLARIAVQLPFDVLPMMISVDFDCNYACNHGKLNNLKRLISKLEDFGCRVNNSFYHVYYRKNTATTLDGGQIGSIISIEDRQNIKQSIVHRKNNCVNCVMDVFGLNSILCSDISDRAKEEIVGFVGTGFVDVVAENFVFSVPSFGEITPNYRFKYYKIISRLRKMLMREGIL